MKLKLIEDWRKSWKLASVRLSLLGATLMVGAQIAGDTWAGLPVEVRNQIPHADTIAMVLFFLVPIARVLTKERKDDE